MDESVDDFLASLEADQCERLGALEPEDSAVDKATETKSVRHKRYLCEESYDG